MARPPGNPALAPAVHDGVAVASVVLGLLWLGGLGALLAVIFGIMSRAKAKRARRQISWMSTAGLVLGSMGLGADVILIYVLIGLASTPGLTA